MSEVKQKRLHNKGQISYFETALGGKMMIPTYTMDSKTYLEFTYPEVRNLCGNFLTLVSAILVFSVTFSEKVVNFQNSAKWARTILLAAWTLFGGAIIGGGASLTMLFLAAGGARDNEGGWQYMMVKGGYCLFLAGGAFCLGLVMLIFSGASALLARPNKTEAAIEADLQSSSEPFE